MSGAEKPPLHDIRRAAGVQDEEDVFLVAAAGDLVDEGAERASAEGRTSRRRPTASSAPAKPEAQQIRLRDRVDWNTATVGRR